MPSIDNTVLTKCECVLITTSFENNNMSIVNEALSLMIVQQPCVSNVRKVFINDYKKHPCNDDDNDCDRMIDTTTNNLTMKHNVNVNFALNDIVSNIESSNVMQCYDSDNDNDEQSKNNDVDDKHHDTE